MTFDAGDVPEEAKPVVLTPVAAPLREGLRVQHIMYAVLVAAFVAWLATVGGLTVLTGSFLLVILLLIALVIGAAVVLVRRTASQRESLLWALAIAAERSLPLAPAARAFADQYGAMFRWRVQLLASLLNDGSPLPEALDQVGVLMSREAELLVRTGHATGTLPRSLRQAAGMRAVRQSAWGGIALRFSYLAFVFFYMQVIIGFLVYFIAPKYEAIFSDFGVPLPTYTIVTLELSHLLVGFLGIPLLLLGLTEMAALVVLPLALFGTALWDVPFADSLFRRRHTALILRALALTTEGGRPIEAGVEQLGRDYPSRWVRRRLVAALSDVRQGGDWVESLGRRRLIQGADAAVLTSARRAGNLDWALREMAESNERRIGYRLQLWLQFLFPMLVLGLGALVFVMAVAYFSPLVHLIERLAG